LYDGQISRAQSVKDRWNIDEAPERCKIGDDFERGQGCLRERRPSLHLGHIDNAAMTALNSEAVANEQESPSACCGRDAWLRWDHSAIRGWGTSGR